MEWPGDGALAAISLVPASGPVAVWPPWLEDEAREALYGTRRDVEAFGVRHWVTLQRDPG